MQSSRGLIDKAIEVNQSALKFCKDKDENCKQELEAQKAKLIELKLKQSIERIEKGSFCSVIASFIAEIWRVYEIHWSYLKFVQY